MLVKHALEPGEKVELQVAFDTEGRPGPFEKKVTLTTNIPGQEEVEVFVMKGTVREAPAAKISVEPRKIVLEGQELNTGRKQVLSISNQGNLPLVVGRIHLKDGNTVYYDPNQQGNVTIEPDQTKEIGIELKGSDRGTRSQEYILIDSNAKNAGKTGYVILVQYRAAGKAAP